VTTSELAARAGTEATAPQPARRVTFAPDATPVVASFARYEDKLSQPLDANVTIFVSYEAKYRAMGVELTHGRLAGIPALAKYPAYHVVATYSADLVASPASYGQNCALSYRVDPSQAWSVFVLEDGVLTRVAQFRSQAAGSAADAVQSGAIPLRAAVNLQTGATPGGRVDKGIFVVAPLADEDAIAAAFLPANYRVVASPLSAPPLDTALEEQFAPDSASLEYATAPRIVPWVNPDGSFTVVWDSGGSIHVSSLDAGGHVTADTTLPPELPRFGGFTRDPGGNFYVFTAKTNADGDFSSDMRLTKYGSSLVRIGACDLPAGKGGDGFDVMKPIEAATSVVTFSNGKVGIHLGKTMHKGPDGLNHQSGILAIVDAQTMQLDRKNSIGQTAAHSFDQKTIADGDGFVLADLADNLPRGIVVTKNRVGRVVFTYKTRLSTKATTRGDKTLGPGMWSNDNDCYTELGGLASASGGYLVLGSSERSLDNGKATGTLNEARNLFVVLVSRDFDRTPAPPPGGGQDEVVTSQVVVSAGETSRDEHFYDFYGGTHAQRNVGVAWLTSYTNRDTENAVRPKLVKVGPDMFVALWEKWDKERYSSTYYLVLDGQGRVTKPATPIGAAHLPRSSDPVAALGHVVWFGGEGGRQRLLASFLTP
jgi:hypothetical protein